MIDLSTLKHGSKNVAKDGETLQVTGSYMSTEGLVIVAKKNSADVCERNVPLSDIAAIVEEIPNGTGP